MRRLALRLREHDWFTAATELAIVVIGILLALQVSNWNEARADARRTRAYLNRIIGDLETDLRVNGNRERFLTNVRRYGQQALAHAETGALAEGSAWKTVLAYFQAGQFYAYSREGSTFTEMRDAGDLGLIHDPQLRSQLAFYYESSTNRTADSMIMNLIPQYRQDIRSVTPMAVQDYIWSHCFRLLPGSGRDQRMIDCPSPVDESDARHILSGYAHYPDLTRELRFWLSNQRIAALTAPEDRRDALQLKASVERELQRLGR
jgi:hypothetical protein